VDPPSSRFAAYTEGNVFRVAVPANWREQQSAESVTFAPDGGYGAFRGQNVFTHGVEIGVSRNETHDLQTATDELLDSLARGNPRLGRPAAYSRASIDGRSGLRTRLTNVSDATGRPETIEVFTALMRDGNLLYVIAVAPRDVFDDYVETFDRIVASIRLL
jgi:hypothetical protein